ncbi:hypothetical protein Rsub_05498 [Raphidocelis subcapitata]|uniref:Uncharacterized protein n=1 Tax=Raphidocelis subcapitata TaxID=307507 RepID=A0A2V0NZX7_9CHLO|nr:hypothetical protein Rsub_05498 [Raphidocelis subcapitata]|eukprot:GBF92879.1 hypothetical protein Rsub_05498 [Raphidocelis subcapitata]
MDLAAFVAVYFSAVAALVALLLFGEAPAFAGTPVPRLHWLVTRGWVDGVEWAVGKVCGARGLGALDAAVVRCCERSNPILQLLYLLVVGTGYAAFWRHVFVLLPNGFASSYHMCAADDSG